MKKIVIPVLLFLAVFTLQAQTYREANIFIPPISGSGAVQDNVYFYKQLINEVLIQQHAVVRTRSTSDYTLIGTIEPYTAPVEIIVPEFHSPIPQHFYPPLRRRPETREFFSWDIENELRFFDTSGEGNFKPFEPPSPDITLSTDEYIFYIELTDSITGKVIGQQNIVYSEIDPSLDRLVSVIIYNILSGIPDVVRADDIRQRYLFIELNGLWTPRIYVSQDNWMNIGFGFGFAAEYHFLNFLSVAFGAQLTQDLIVSSVTGEEECRDIILEIPVTVRFVSKPLENFMLQTYTGVSVNYSFMQTTMPSPLSLLLGFQFGIKVGPGMIILDPRFSLDIFSSSVQGRDLTYDRYMVQTGIGYKFGLFPKRNKRDY
ncbi:MAG: hypothetical protein FWD40_05025 [Treponema sp.]|nr:hypothetical protein [Treponema sp.]